MLPSSRSNIITKGNDGKGARSIYQRRLLLLTGTFFVGILCVMLLSYESEGDKISKRQLAYDMKMKKYLLTQEQDKILEHELKKQAMDQFDGKVPDDDSLVRRAREKVMRKLDREAFHFEKGVNGDIRRSKIKQEHVHHGPKIGNGPKFSSYSSMEEEELLRLVVTGEVSLYDLKIVDSRSDHFVVKGVFCHLDWSRHKEDPSSSAMFREITRVSGCDQNNFQMDIETVMEAVRDGEFLDENAVKALQPKGFVFHESRCGSTLVANALSAFDSDKNRVYSESQPPAIVMGLCSHVSKCNEDLQIDLLQDVIYLMGLTNDLNEENLFFKFQSRNSLSIHVARRAFPDVPWIFVHRDPVQVMMSHLGQGDDRAAVCLRTRKHIPSETAALIERIDGFYSPSNTEYCAAYLASLCESVHHEAVSSGTGRIVEYSSLPDILMDDIIPKYFLENSAQFGDKERQNIFDVSQKYSKGMGRRAGEWHEDSTAKEANATPEIVSAAEKYLGPVYSILLNMSAEKFVPE